MLRTVVAAGLAVTLQSGITPKKGGNPEAARIKNPAPPSAESLAAGRKSYQKLCGKCHGPEGKGDGTAATGSKQPTDLTAGHWEYGGSDGEIFSVIHEGTSLDMEGYAARMTDTEIWNVVNYLKSLGAKP